MMLEPSVCNLVTTLYEDTKQSNRAADFLWIGTAPLNGGAGGLSKFDRRTGRFTGYKHNPRDPSSLSDNWITAICRDRYGTLWIGTNGGLEKFDESSGKSTHYKFDPINPMGPSSDYLKSIREDASGTLWVGAWGGGLMKFNRATDTFTRYQYDPEDNNSLSSNEVQVVYEDRSGTIWVGTGGGGVCKFDRTRRSFTQYANDKHVRGSLHDDDVRVISEVGDSEILIGTSTGLTAFDPGRRIFTPCTPWDLWLGPVTALLADRSGTLWTGRRDGLIRIDRSPYKRTFYDPLVQNLGFPNTVSVFSIHEDRNGLLWMMVGMSGLCKFDRTTGHFTQCNIGKGGTDFVGGLILEDTTTSAIQRGSTLWIGTNEGLWRYNTETDSSTRFVHDVNNVGSLSSNLILSLCKDAHGTMWVGTDKGLDKFDPVTGTCEHYDENDGLPTSQVLGILEDARGRIWLSTYKGIGRFDPRERQFNRYDVADGLPSNQFSVGCCLRSSSGEMYFGGNRGFVRFHPDSIQDNPHIPPVAITGFKKFGRDVQLDSAMSEKRMIKLSYKDNAISFEFAALDYNNSGKNQFAYRLDGFNDDWVYCGTRHNATYTNLGGGTYVFRVKGSNNDGLWNEVGASIAVIVTPPFWATWWFRGFVFFAMLLSVGGSIRYVEMKKLNRKIERLEQERAVEQERLRISQDMHDEVGSALSEIAILSELVKKEINDPHNAEAHIHKISDRSREVTQSISQIVWAINPKNDPLKNLVAYIRHYAVQYFTASPIRCHCNFPETVPEVRLSAEARRNVFLAVKESLHNIVKHSSATDAVITLRQTGTNIEILIEDNGRGFLPGTRATFGNGLENMTMRLAQIKGACEVQSSPGAGTRVRIVFGGS